MVSNGGQATPALAAREPVRTLLSGPAGGAVAVSHLCRRLGLPPAIAFDMGGTSTGVCVYDGASISRAKRRRIPDPRAHLDLHRGGGGGSSRDSTGGALRVGPESAGADQPGLLAGRARADCHRRARRARRIHPELFFGGGWKLDVRAAGARRGQDRSGRRRRHPRQRANLERAVRAVSVGGDATRRSLCSFGGAGPLHGCDLAEPSA